MADTNNASDEFNAPVTSNRPAVPVPIFVLQSALPVPLELISNVVDVFNGFKDEITPTPPRPVLEAKKAFPALLVVVTRALLGLLASLFSK